MNNCECIVQHNIHNCQRDTCVPLDPHNLSVCHITPAINLMVMSIALSSFSMPCTYLNIYTFQLSFLLTDLIYRDATIN